MAALFQMTSLDDEYIDTGEYADFVDDICNRIRDDLVDDDEVDSDDEQIGNNRHATDLEREGTSYLDEMNLIDYVVDEENEIGGAKGEDSHSTSRSTTYSRYGK